jgi:hypothetical protein
MADEIKGVDYLYENPGEQLHVQDGKAVRLQEQPLENLFDTSRGPGGSRLQSPSEGDSAPPLAGMGGTRTARFVEQASSARKPTEEELEAFAKELAEQYQSQELEPSAMEPVLRNEYGDQEVPAWLQAYMQRQPTTGTQVVDAIGNNHYLSEDEKRKYRLKPWKRK